VTAVPSKLKLHPELLKNKTGAIKKPWPETPTRACSPLEGSINEPSSKIQLKGYRVSTSPEMPNECVHAIVRRSCSALHANNLLLFIFIGARSIRFDCIVSNNVFWFVLRVVYLIDFLDHWMPVMSETQVG
jgi:hypothetical protein